MLLARIIRRLLARSSSGARAGWPKLVLALIVIGALPALAYWRGLGTESSDLSGNVKEMTVEDLQRATSGEGINLVLKEKAGPRRLVLQIGQMEALSILEDVNPSQKMPASAAVSAYTTTRSIASGLGGKVERVVVNNMTDKALFAKVVLSMENREIVIDAPPSDAIALAVRAKAPIFVDTLVLDRVGVPAGR